MSPANILLDTIKESLSMLSVNNQDSSVSNTSSNSPEDQVVEEKAHIGPRALVEE